MTPQIDLGLDGGYADSGNGMDLALSGLEC
jgi:hypothetical protein